MQAGIALSLQPLAMTRKPCCVIARSRGRHGNSSQYEAISQALLEVSSYFGEPQPQTLSSRSTIFW